jgi:hypothetical protein
MMPVIPIIGPSLAEFNAECNFTEPQAYIYGLHDPRTGELRYIGKSIRPIERLGNHINERTNTHRGHWIAELTRLSLRPVLVIIDSVPANSDWQSIERVYIAGALEDGCRLTNSTAGGEGIVGLCAESRAKMAITWVGRKHSPETLALMSANRKGRKHTPEWCREMSERFHGRKFTPEWLQKIRKSNQKLTDNQVRQIRLRLSLGESQYTIAALFGIHQGSVSNIKRGITYKDVL